MQQRALRKRKLVVVTAEQTFDFKPSQQRRLNFSLLFAVLCLRTRFLVHDVRQLNPLVQCADQLDASSSRLASRSVSNLSGTLDHKESASRRTCRRSERHRQVAVEAAIHAQAGRR